MPRDGRQAGDSSSPHRPTTPAAFCMPRRPGSMVEVKMETPVKYTFDALSRRRQADGSGGTILSGISTDHDAERRSSPAKSERANSTMALSRSGFSSRSE